MIRVEKQSLNHAGIYRFMVILRARQKRFRDRFERKRYDWRTRDGSRRLHDAGMDPLVRAGEHGPTPGISRVTAWR